MLKVVGPQSFFDYLLNDPTTPELVLNLPLPNLPENAPKLSVVGFRSGPIVQEDAIRIQAASVLTTINTTVSWVQKIRPFNKWYGGEVLTVIPRAGKSMNAYYDRWGLHFHYDLHPITRKVVFTADSPKAVSHELGHAILDVFRPDLWNANDVESISYKEAFGDIICILTSLQHKTLIEYALKETAGNLRKSNVLSRVSEEVGNVLYHLSPEALRSPDYVRDATEYFTYKTPNSIPIWRPYTELCREPHNFSRIFIGAWYEILMTIFDQYKTSSSEIEALIQSRDRLASITLLCLSQLKSSGNIYLDMAKAMLETEKELGGQFAQLIKEVFIVRGILTTILL